MGRKSLWIVRWIVILGAICGGCANATSYYVSVKGNDSNPGTAAQPWRSIAKVNSADLGPGDRVLFAGGETFEGTIRLDKSDSGSPGSRVEVGSYGEGRATINGGNGSGLVAEGCSYLAIRNLTFVGSGRKEGNTESGVVVSDGDGIEVDQVDVSGFRGTGLLLAGLRDARATHVYAHNNGADGIAVGAGLPPDERWSERIYIGYCVAENNPGNPVNLDNHSGNGIVVGGVRGCVIEYCEAMNNGWDMPRKGNGPVGIWAWNADQVIIQFCVAHHNKSPGWDGGGFDLDGGVTNSIMQYNYSHDNEGPGYFLCQYWSAPVWKNNIVRYNISVNDGAKNNVGCGIEVMANNGGMSDAEVYNNTVYNEKGGAVGFGDKPVPGVRLRNNVFVTKGEIIKGDCSYARFEGNWYWSVGDGFEVGEHNTFEDWVEATGQERSGEKVLGRYGDPLLVEAGSVPEIKPEDLTKLAAYRLKHNSPCIGAGLAIPDSGGRDFWGNEVPDGEGVTIGACQKP
ncbi:MAG: right-handed parallel beta-helix repeat-containing protein [Armatimonadota bacterium]|nr:MAG: right-handed parallel beta-helix repeat-containing protein [Armatimonadota bacterium]